eukprot:3487924-Prorocentrum_lima.AAC.1
MATQARVQPDTSALRWELLLRRNGPPLRDESPRNIGPPKMLQPVCQPKIASLTSCLWRS